MFGIVNIAVPVSSSVRTTAPDVHEFAGLVVIVVNAADDAFQTISALAMSPAATARRPAMRRRARLMWPSGLVANVAMRLVPYRLPAPRAERVLRPLLRCLRRGVEIVVLRASA